MATRYITGSMQAGSASISGSVQFFLTISGSVAAALASLSGVLLSTHYLTLSVAAGPASISGALRAYTQTISGSLVASPASISGALSAVNISLSLNLVAGNASFSGTLAKTTPPKIDWSFTAGPAEVDATITVKKASSDYQAWEILHDRRLLGARVMIPGPGDHVLVGCYRKVVMVETGTANKIVVQSVSPELDGQVIAMYNGFETSFAGLGGYFAVTTETELGGKLYLLKFEAGMDIIFEVALEEGADPNVLAADFDLGLIIVAGANGSLVLYEGFEADLTREVGKVATAGYDLGALELLLRPDYSRWKTNTATDHGDVSGDQRVGLMQFAHIAYSFDNRGGTGDATWFRRTWDRRDDLP